MRNQARDKKTRRRPAGAKLRLGLRLAAVGAGVSLAALLLVHLSSLGKGVATAAVVGVLLMAYEVYSL